MEGLLSPTHLVFILLIVLILKACLTLLPCPSLIGSASSVTAFPLPVVLRSGLPRDISTDTAGGAYVASYVCDRSHVTSGTMNTQRGAARRHVGSQT